MNTKKKFNIIKRNKLQNFSTPKEMFKYFFQNQINLDFLTEYGATKDTLIDFNSQKGKTVSKSAFEFIESIISKYGNFKIHINHLILTPNNTLGIIHIDNIGNNNNLYFKHFSSHPDSLFYNIVGLINPVLLNKSNLPLMSVELDTFLQTINIKNRDEFRNFLTQKIILYTLDTFSKIKNLLIEISKWLNKGILIFQDSINPSISENKNIINCTDKSINLLASDVLILHVSYKENFLFQPVININLKDKSKINYIIKNIENNKAQKQYFFDLLEKEKKIKDTIRLATSPDTLKVGKSQVKYIYFNPYDKNKLLPLIEINITSSKKKTYLLGHEFNGLYNIYEDDDSINDLVGQIKFNENTTIDVDWCEGYEPEK